jgi:hypothetical protein
MTFCDAARGVASVMQQPRGMDMSQRNVLRTPSKEPDREALEHRFTDTPDGSLAGSWWIRDVLVPWCIWSYDVDAHRLSVTRSTATRTTQLPRSAALTSEPEQRKMLPLLALHLARDMRRPVRG